MNLNEQKQQFSFAYVRAVASVAGYSVSRPDVDDDSVDLTIGQRGGGGTVRSPKIDVQVKCLATAGPILTDFPFDLEIKNYDELRYSDFPYPRMLIVVAVPNELNDWLRHSEKELALSHCGYWVSLRGLPEVPNSSTRRISVPRVQHFNVEQLREIMQRVRDGGHP